MFINRLEVPYRTKKPRKKGLTSIMDVGLSTRELEMILNDYSDYVDIAKLGVGIAAVSPNLEEKISLYHKFDIKVYFGGTLFEKFHFQNRLTNLKDILLKYEIDFVEISNGTIDLSLSERKDLISFFTGSDIDVLCEVGSKDKQKTMPPSEWINEIEILLKEGAKYVITEGRNSGTAGLFGPNGELRTDLIDDIIHTIDPANLILEAPTGDSQMFLINLIGSNVNLGNVNPHDILLLEAERVGLRSETFKINS
ncbi:phosphosulfolactate synthase [Fodinibius salsisoli]|uniref:Phosphosulfolactate synthase n=1 Tax=Fodinibius salsisoli TaxID=2820877 RepID=A0ABT3PTG4_9BACT|nr:phosphosulfolactate synthase [Fodinibius salsisoli]MCW9709136.1 phosphosulfolactate synthase [Fodinibius salsisoli]